MTERLSERERIIEEITSRMDWTAQDIEKIADFILTDRARIVAPLVPITVMTAPYDIRIAVNETLKRANLGE